MSKSDTASSDTASSDTANPNTAVDPDRLKKFAFQVWSYKQGEMVSLMLHIGDRLGLFTKLAELVEAASPGAASAGSPGGLVTSQELATATGLNERLIREWLFGLSAAGMLAHTDGAFSISPEAKALLVDEQDSVLFAMGAFRGGTETEALDLILESFRTGIGMTYEQQGPRAASGLARTTGPFSRQALVSTIIPALAGTAAKLDTGGKVLDVGCGAGVTACLIGEAWPNAKVIGYDPSQTAIDQARQRALDHGLSNVEFVAAPAAEINQTGETPAKDADLVLTFDCLHDMPRPDDALKAIREAISEDGTLLIKDIRSGGDFTADMRNPLLAMFYGFSVSSCLQSAMSEPGGMALGTLGLHPDKARQLITAAGFTRFEEHDFADAANIYYEVRP